MSYVTGRWCCEHIGPVCHRVAAATVHAAMATPCFLKLDLSFAITVET